MINENKKGVKAVKHTVKAKNPIAVAHQKTGGSKAGTHKNKVKEIPRKTKHKTADYAEHLNTMLKQAINEEGLSPQKRLQLIQFISQTKGWDVSDVSLASDPELIDMYKKIKAGQDLDETDHAHEFKVGQKAEYVGLHSKLPPFPVVVTNVDGDYIEFRSASGQPIPGTNGETEWSGDPGWKVLKPSRTYNPNSLVGATSRAEGWTTDTLAAELFEQDHSYEDRLNRMLEGKLSFDEAYGRRDAYQRDYDSSTSGFGRRREIDDEANLLYIYKDGRVKQRMVSNHEERAARAEGFRDSPEQALKLHGILRSKFDPKKFIQKQGSKWIEVFPFGEQKGVSETLFSSKPTEGADGGEEYNDEVGMIRNDLHTMIRCAKELEEILSSNENVAEWAQEKIAVAKSMIVTILDYVASEHELGHKYKNK